MSYTTSSNIDETTSNYESDENITLESINRFESSEREYLLTQDTIEEVTNGNKHF